MSYWDSKAGEIVRYPARKAHKEGWLTVDCGCCGGVEWGAIPPPRECRQCNGGGRIFCHIETGTLARWIGGPLIGAHATDEEITHWLKEAEQRNHP